ncbi:hypothetical protein [Streptomyces sp. x-19]|uniref:hypothetical protein n=1 Tax=Streptomyces sp. x-19 TaxID=2789280 RepID=UPI00397FDB0E
MAAASVPAVPAAGRNATGTAEADLVQTDVEGHAPHGGRGGLDVAAQQTRERTPDRADPATRAATDAMDDARQLPQQAHHLAARQTNSHLPGHHLLQLQNAEHCGALGGTVQARAGRRRFLGGRRTLQHRLQRQMAGVLSVHGCPW